VEARRGRGCDRASPARRLAAGPRRASPDIRAGRSSRGALLLVGTVFVARALVPNRYVGFFKFLRTTRWAKYDTRLFSPLFLILGLLIFSQTL